MTNVDHFTLVNNKIIINTRIVDNIYSYYAPTRLTAHILMIGAFTKKDIFKDKEFVGTHFSICHNYQNKPMLDISGDAIILDEVCEHRITRVEIKCFCCRENPDWIEDCNIKH